MAKATRQKSKLLYIAQYLMEHTDEKHSVTMAQLIEYLASNGISAERKSIYNDIDTLNAFGMDIVRTGSPHSGYQLASRNFELAEVKLLVDLVQSAKFITSKKSRELIAKLEREVSRNEAHQLQRQVIVLDRNKTSNESIYYNVDVIYAAIAENVKVRYQYFEWDEKKQRRLRKNGEDYEVSPWLLIWDNENYYLVAYDSEAGFMKHYRVDKMLKIRLTKEPREGQKVFEDMDIAAFSQKTFGMFAGKERTVRLAFEDSLTGVVVDRFGESASMRRLDEKHVAVRAAVEVSSQFFGWLAGFGSRVEILGPEDVRQQYQDYIYDIVQVYQKDNAD